MERRRINRIWVFASNFQHIKTHLRDLINQRQVFLRRERRYPDERACANFHISLTGKQPNVNCVEQANYNLCGGANKTPLERHLSGSQQGFGRMFGLRYDENYDQGALVSSGRTPGVCTGESPLTATEIFWLVVTILMFSKPTEAIIALTHSLFGSQNTVGSKLAFSGPLGMPNGLNLATGVALSAGFS